MPDSLSFLFPSVLAPILPSPSFLHFFRGVLFFFLSFLPFPPSSLSSSLRSLMSFLPSSLLRCPSISVFHRSSSRPSCLPAPSFPDVLPSLIPASLSLHLCLPFLLRLALAPFPLPPLLFLLQSFLPPSLPSTRPSLFPACIRSP